MRNKHYESDDKAFPANAYRVHGYAAIAFTVYGWELEPDEETRTGNVVAVMVGDDRRHSIDPDDLIALNGAEYCADCGQIGCTCNAYG